MLLVKQEHTDGCFIACVAMLIGVNYQLALELVHDKKVDRVGLTRGESLAKLVRLGYQLIVVENRRLDQLQHDALIFIRWKQQPAGRLVFHAVMYDAETKSILDPSSKKLSWKEYQQKLDNAYYFKKINYETI